MAVLPIEAITDDSLPEFCAFLGANMGANRSPDEWLAAFRVPWQSRHPNFGFLLRDVNGEIAGGLGAIYSRQLIKGREYDFCNLTSWCVKEAFRAQSMRLAMALTGQAGFEVTNFSPTKVVAGVLRFLNFRELDERISYFPNLPLGYLMGAAVKWDPREIEQSLQGDLGRVYRDHAQYRWLKFGLLEAEQKKCLIVLKSVRVKSLRGAKILYVSDRELYAKYLRAVSGSLLFRFGFLFTQIESRFLSRKVAFAKEVGGYTKKLFLSKDLSATEIDYIYSESMCLDLS